MNEAAFNITKISYPLINFLSNPSFKDKYFEITHLENGGTIGLQLKGEITFENKKILFCLLDLNIIFNNDKYNDLARMNIQIIGEFTSANEWSKETVQSFHPNFYSILFPFLRETVYTLSSKNDFSFLLEPVNFIKTLENETDQFSIDFSKMV